MMSIGKTDVDLDVERITLFIGEFKIFEKGQLIKNYSEIDVSNYMKNSQIEIFVELNQQKEFTCYTMDLTQKYISMTLIIEVRGYDT